MKNGNRSTRLGLSLCHDIIREHGGQIIPMWEPGEYTIMTVLLPRDPGKTRAIGMVRSRQSG